MCSLLPLSFLQKKYRIVEVLCNGKKHYEVEKRLLFFFWLTETYIDYYIDGRMASNYPIEFISFDEAQNYINECKIKNSPL